MTQPSSRPPSTFDPLNPERKEIKSLVQLFKRTPLTLTDYYAIGQQMSLLAADTTLTGYGKACRKKVAEVVGQSDSTLTKCLQFFRSYQKDEVAELEQLGVGWMQLIIALGVRDKKKRQRLLRRARDEKWGQRELRREARRLKGSYRGGGRPRKREKSRGCLADASELVRRTDQWTAFHEQAWSGNDENYLAELDQVSREARDSLERVLTDAEGKLQALQEQCEAALKTVEALRKKLPWWK